MSYNVWKNKDQNPPYDHFGDTARDPLDWAVEAARDVVGTLKQRSGFDELFDNISNYKDRERIVDELANAIRKRHSDNQNIDK